MFNFFKKFLLFLLISTSLYAREEDRPNIILIMADDMGYECVGANGGLSYKTPRLDAMAAQGMRFTQCHAQPLCTPSRVQIMTGRYNHRNYTHFAYLDPKEMTFAHVLKEKGYTTCIAGKWQLNGTFPRLLPGHEDKERPFQFGFEEYCLWQLTQQRRGKERYAHAYIEQNGKDLGKQEKKFGPDVFCAFICEFMEKNKEKPFFAYYPMVLPHDPFVKTPDHPNWLEKPYLHRNAHFPGMVAYTDKIVGKILDKVAALGLSEKTLILFTTDNGTLHTITSQTKEGAIRGGKGQPTDAGTHVPLIAYWKGKIKPGSLNTELIDFSDFLPTLAEAGGAPLPQGRKIDGLSFFPQLLGDKGTPRPWIFCHYHPFPSRKRSAPIRFARDKQFKLYQNGRFFDLSTDSEEKNPLKKEQLTPIAQKARGKLEDVLASFVP